MKQNKVYEIRLKIFLLRDIPVIKIMGEEAEFIDSALAKDSKWLEYHEKGDIYGSDIYERTTGIKIDRIDGTADGHFYDGEFTL